MGALRENRLLMAAAGLLMAVAVMGGVGAASWWERSFPGFLVLENRVVASVGLALWPATADGEIYQHEIVAVDGEPLGDVAELWTFVERVPVGTPVEYRLRRGESETTRRIETRRFGTADFALLFGLYLINGLFLGGAALLALRALPRNPSAASAVPLLLVGALWALSALDLYGPYRLFRLHALCEAFLFPAALHMALGFPHRARCLERWPGLVWVPYGLAALLAVAYELQLTVPGAYVTSHLLATSAFGAALVALLVSEVERFLRPAQRGVREQVQVLAQGAVLALSLPVCLTLAELLTGGRAPQNAIALTAFVFPLSIAYAIVRQDLWTLPRSVSDEA